jgi:parallel beta-helix repeat protein
MKKRGYLGILIVVLVLAGIPAVAGINRCVNVSDSSEIVCDDSYATINLAHTAAKDYDTIYVGPGLYKERITISKQITLKGATEGVSKKNYAVPTESDNYRHDYYISESIIDPETAVETPVVTISSANVTFDGFVVSMTVAPKPSSAYPATDLLRVGALNASNVVIQNNVFGPNLNLTNNDGMSGRMGITISKFSQTGDNRAYNIQIRDNKIYDLKGDSCGILMTGVKNTSSNYLTNPPTQYQFKGTVIDNNEITGIHRSAIDFSGGMQGSPTEHIKITNNIISNNGWYDNPDDRDNIKWGNGIVLMRMTNQNESIPWASRYIDIEDNVFSNNEKNGIYIGPITRNVTIKNNIIQNNGLGTGGVRKWDGIRIDLDEEYQQKERILQNEPSTDQLTIYDHLTNISIEKNKISGNGGYGLNVTQTPLKGLVDARRNYWGSSSGPKNIIINPSGTGQTVSAFVRLSPWYTSTEKTTIQSSVSGDSGILPVSHVSPGNYTTIQTAINAASSGDNVKVYPGVYDERIVINKSLTLLGASSGISKKDYVVPAGYLYDESKESIISPSFDKDEPVVQIKLGSVTVDGFIVENLHANQHPEFTYPHTDLISINNDTHQYTGVTIKNNVVGPNTNIDSQDGTKGRMGIVVPGARKEYVHSLTIANNKIFNATGDGCGILLLGSQNTSTQALAAVYKGSVIENNTISGNHRSGIEFSGGVQGGVATPDHFRITNNNITNNGWNSTADKNNIKYGNGIILVRIGSDITTYKQQYSSSWGSRYVDIDNNLISDNEKNGIYIGPSNRYITITNNIISKNGAGTNDYSIWDGVQVDLDESYQKATDKNYGNLTKIVLKSNDIIDNGDYGVRVIQTPTLGSIDAKNNWWGSASGPRATKSASWTASNVSENVIFSPWYTSPIKTSTGLPKPMATFTVDPVENVTGSTFSFDASASESQSKSTIKSYQWNYGDGNTKDASGSPLASHIYTSSKVYTITLTVKDSKDMTNSTTRQVSVIAKKEAIPLTFNGTTVSGTTGKQEITFDPNAVNGTMTNSTKEVKIENPSNGWSEMLVKGNTSGGNGAPVTIKDITEVVLKSNASVTQLDTTTSEGTAGPGAVTTSLELSLKQFATAPLQVEVTQGANDTVSNAFQLAAGSGNKVDAVAYTMTIKGSSLINSNLSSSSEPVVLNMSVSEAWVQAHGGVDAIKVIRYSDDGTTKEVLETQYLFSAGTPVMYYFKVISPHGCSIFGVTSVVAVPPSSGGSTTSESAHVEQPSDDTGMAARGEKAEPVAVPPPVVPQESSAPVQPQPTFGAPLVTPEEPGEIPLAGPAEAEIGRSMGGVLAFISENIVAIGAGAATITLCAGLVIWYRRRQQYW